MPLDRWNADKVIVEQAASGLPLVHQLRREDPKAWRYIAIKPRFDKRTRLEAQTARLETGAYLLPSAAPWLEDLRRELLAF